jgi:hypothetical protein
MDRRPTLCTGNGLRGIRVRVHGNGGASLDVLKFERRTGKERILVTVVLTEEDAQSLAAKLGKR